MSALVIALILAVAWFTAAATAVRTVSRIWLRHWVEQQLTGSTSAEVFLEHPQRLLLAAGTAIAGLTLAIGVAVGMASTSPAALLRGLLTAGVLLLVVGQVIPRAVARRWGMGLIPVLLPALQGLGMLVSPLLGVAERFARTLAPPVPVAPEDPRDALEDLLREGELEGVGEADESAIISGVVEFGVKRVRDVMTPRDQMVTVDRALPAAELARRVAQSAFSRVPVVDGDVDHVVGMLHSFDVLERPDDPAARLRKVSFALPDMPCLDLMRAMLRERRHLAIVRDAAGRTVGLATLEDLVEELVGDISDEHDEAAPGGAA